MERVEKSKKILENKKKYLENETSREIQDKKD